MAEVSSANESSASTMELRYTSRRNTLKAENTGWCDNTQMAFGTYRLRPFSSKRYSPSISVFLQSPFAPTQLFVVKQRRTVTTRAIARAERRNTSVLECETEREEIGTALLLFKVPDFRGSRNAALRVTSHEKHPRIANSREIYASCGPPSGIDPQSQQEDSIDRCSLLIVMRSNLSRPVGGTVTDMK